MIPAYVLNPFAPIPMGKYDTDLKALIDAGGGFCTPPEELPTLEDIFGSAQFPEVLVKEAQKQKDEPVMLAPQSNEILWIGFSGPSPGYTLRSMLARPGSSSPNYRDFIYDEATDAWLLPDDLAFNLGSMAASVRRHAVKDFPGLKTGPISLALMRVLQLHRKADGFDLTAKTEAYLHYLMETAMELHWVDARMAEDLNVKMKEPEA